MGYCRSCLVAKTHQHVIGYGFICESCLEILENPQILLQEPYEYLDEEVNMPSGNSPSIAGTTVRE